LIPNGTNIQITAQLYKLIIYGKGSFFKPHVDTPRGDTHFGTLIVVPPCKHVGGELIIRHQGNEKSYNFSTSGKKKAQYVAFFTDCQHEINELTKGFRISLAYNLLRPAAVTIAPPIAAAHTPVVKLINHMINTRVDGDPVELGYLFSYKYAAKSMTPAGLKGIDRLYYSLVESVFKDKVRIAALEIRVNAWGRDDEGRYISLRDVVGNCDTEIDEIDTSAVPDKSKGSTGYPARPIWKGSKGDSFSDESDDGHVVWVDSDNIVASLQRQKKIDQSIEGSGNEGCDFHQKYLHGAILINISDNKKLPYPDFSMEYASRSYEYYGC